ncbi:unnamed protein product [Camellia sinensis]
MTIEMEGMEGFLKMFKNICKPVSSIHKMNATLFGLGSSIDEFSNFNFLGLPALRRNWDRVGNMKEGIEFLELCGFERVDEGKFLFLPEDKVDMAVLKSAGNVLDSAITNPFFGLLSRSREDEAFGLGDAGLSRSGESKSDHGVK